jgi:hypothetical protein
MNTAAELDAMLADLAERAADFAERLQAVRDFQCAHGYECRATRTPARRMIALAKQWRSEFAARRDTLSNVATPRLRRVGSADTAGPPSVEGSNECRSVQR